MRQRSRLSVLATAGLSLALTGFAFTVTPVSASEPRAVVADTSPVPATDAIVHQVITTSFDLVLRQPRQAALASYIAGLSNTASTNFHRYLTPAQFATEFGASSSTISAVGSYMTGYGLHVTSLSKGHTLLHVTGRTSDIARAFATPLDTVRTSSGLEAQFASEATLPVSIAHDVVGVAGLSSVVPPTTPSLSSHMSSRVTTPTSCPGATTAGSSGGFTAQQQAQLYGLSTAYSNGDTGVGQTIAVYELGQYGQSDLTTYFSCYGIAPLVKTFNVDSGISQGYNVGSPAEEATLDVEEAAVLAPGAAIEVYQGPNSSSGPTDTYQQIADDNTASIVSTSWGTCEADPSGDAMAEQVIFQQMAAQGQTVVAASGDSGSSDCAANADGTKTTALAVDDPASQPYVTGVGGLTISSTSPLIESVWNSGSASSGAGGGGISSVWPRPTWQMAPGIVASETMRMVPDLSTMADPATGFLEYYTGSGTGLCHRSCATGWASIGGTSIGAPLVSAIVAVAAQSCSTSRLGFINPSLYAMANAGVGFNDVTTGNNNLYNVGGYSAATGYDMASGLGSPDGIAFINGLCPAPLDPAKSSFATSTQSPLVKSSVTVTALLRTSSSNPVANALVNVSASAASGVIIIDGDTASSTTLGKATYSVNSDATGNASFTVTTDTAGPVTVTVTYAGQTVYTTTLGFLASRVVAAVPGRATIKSLTPLTRGFKIIVSPPTSSGTGPITAYQFSIDAGRTWTTISSATRTATVLNLLRSHSYTVVVRALNAKGAGARSPATRVTTLP